MPDLMNALLGGLVPLLGLLANLFVGWKRAQRELEAKQRAELVDRLRQLTDVGQRQSDRVDALETKLHDAREDLIESESEKATLQIQLALERVGHRVPLSELPKLLELPSGQPEEKEAK